MKWYEICIDLAFYIDIILNFWTGVDRGYEIETDKKAIAKVPPSSPPSPPATPGPLCLSRQLARGAAVYPCTRTS